MAMATLRNDYPDTPQTGLEARLAIRSNQHDGPTNGMAPGFVQANLAILPRALAEDFMRFCQLNPKPCPLIGVGAPGDWRLPVLAADLDIRTDLPRYRVWRDGAVVDEPHDLMRWWRDDLVTFALGCSFSFEQALIEDGIELRHFTCDCTVPMYRTSVECTPAGAFRGKLVVSMRPMTPAAAVAIDVRYIGTVQLQVMCRSSMPSSIKACSNENEQPMAKVTRSSRHQRIRSCGSSASAPSRQTR